jgi:hypothetical protein
MSRYLEPLNALWIGVCRFGCPGSHGVLCAVDRDCRCVS